MITLWLLKKTILEPFRLAVRVFAFLTKAAFYMTIGMFSFFTVPIWLLLWVLCKIIKADPPGMKRWKTVFYPSWEGGGAHHSTKVRRNSANRNTSPMSGYGRNGKNEAVPASASADKARLSDMEDDILLWEMID